MIVITGVWLWVHICMSGACGVATCFYKCVCEPLTRLIVVHVDLWDMIMCMSTVDEWGKGKAHLFV